MEKTIFTSQKNRFCLEQKGYSLKIGLHASIMVSTSQILFSKTILFHLDGKGFHSFCFCWWKPLFQLERIKFLKNNLLPANGANGNQEEPNFQKVILFRLMKTDFRAFFLLLETIIEIRQNSIFKRYYCQEKFICGRRNRFSGQGKTFFFSIFQRLL